MLEAPSLLGRPGLLEGVQPAEADRVAALELDLRRQLPELGLKVDCVLVLAQVGVDTIAVPTSSRK